MARTVLRERGDRPRGTGEFLAFCHFGFYLINLLIKFFELNARGSDEGDGLGEQEGLDEGTGSARCAGQRDGLDEEMGWTRVRPQ